MILELIFGFRYFILYEILHLFVLLDLMSKMMKKNIKEFFRNILKMEYNIDEKLNISKEYVQLIKLYLNMIMMKEFLLYKFILVVVVK